MEYYGQNITTGGGSEDPIDKILERYFPNQKTGTAIEAGANDGLYLSSCLYFGKLGWKVINIEASEHNYKKLIENRPESVNHFFALSNINSGLVEISHFDFDNGGMDGNPNHCTRLTKGKIPASKNYIQTIRYDFLIQEPIDLFVLDVEGMEIEVISGMANTKYWPKVFCIEHAHLGKDIIFGYLSDKYTIDYIDNLNMVLVLK